MDAPTAHRGAPRLRLKTDERQREIVAAVLLLARERGPDSITTQAIADRIGVTQGALFRHFPDKEAIWLAVFAWVRESLGAVLDEAVAKANSPLGKIERAFLAHVAFVAANPGVPRVLFHELQYPGRLAGTRRGGSDDHGLQQAPGAALHRRPRRRASFPPISMPPSLRYCSSAPYRAWSSSPRSPATRPR